MENSSKRKRLRAPSPAMIVACIALAIALSGVGYAAITIPNNSVGTAQLKNNAVSNAKLQGNSVGSGKLQNNAVNSAKVADGSLTGDDIDQASLDAVDAATLGGLSSDDFLQVPENGFDSYVASGSSWIDRDGADRAHESVTFNGRSTWCTTVGATSGTEAAAYQDVHLPDGATIVSMSVDYVDDPVTFASNGNITLSRQPIFSGDGTNADILDATLTDVTPAGDMAHVEDTQVPPATPAIAVVDNANYAYTLMGKPGIATTVVYCSVKVTYALP